MPARLLGRRHHSASSAARAWSAQTLGMQLAAIVAWASTVGFAGLKPLYGEAGKTVLHCRAAFPVTSLSILLRLGVTGDTGMEPLTAQKHPENPVGPAV